MQELSNELVVFALSVVLLVVHIVWQSTTVTGEAGKRYNLGPRDEEPALSPLAGRLIRALRNFLETYPAFVGLALALHVTGRTGGIGELGAWLWLASRVAFLPLYAMGVYRWRSLAWVVSLLGLVLMLVRLVFAL